MPVAIRTKRFAVCPRCGQGEWGVEHLFTHGMKSAGPWSCSNCEAAFVLEVDLEAETIEFRERPDLQQKRCLVLLEIPPQEHPIRLIVEGFEQTADEHSYYYEEHTCPENYLRSTLAVELNGRRDPHGLATFISAFAWQDDAENLLGPKE